MVQNKSRPGGRPRKFDPNVALDRAVEVFWAKGYAAASLDDLTLATGINRPSLYAAFGDKERLFLRALERYGAGIGAEPLAAFREAPTVRGATRAFLTASVANNTRPGGPSGCLLACSAAGCAETLPAARAFLAAALEAIEQTIAARFEAAAGDELPADFPCRERARLLVDLMQGLALRARSGEAREQLLLDAAAHAGVVVAS